MSQVQVVLADVFKNIDRRSATNAIARLTSIHPDAPCASENGECYLRGAIDDKICVTEKHANSTVGDLRKLVVEALEGSCASGSEEFTFTVGIDVPAFATITVTGASTLAGAIEELECRALTLEPREFAPDVDEWQDRLRLVSVRNADDTLNGDALNGILLKNDLTNLEQRAFDVLTELIGVSEADSIFGEPILSKVRSLVADLKAAQIPADAPANRDWKQICAGLRR
ncbi:MAG TPA: hypothetical protein VF450_05450 [Noviherbaspirillum sp.]